LHIHSEALIGGALQMPTPSSGGGGGGGNTAAFSAGGAGAGVDYYFQNSEKYCR